MILINDFFSLKNTPALSFFYRDNIINVSRLLIVIFSGIILSGCFISSRDSFDNQGYENPPQPSSTTPQTSSGSVAVGYANTAGFGLGDGPPSEQRDIDSIPNAVPKWEPRSKSGNPASYLVQGKRYYVMDSAEGYSAEGIASWYGQKFHGRRTSSGETYDMFGMTAAHPSLPLPSYLRVTRLGNDEYTGKQIIVKVNDRGPFLGGRLIDLSYAAASKLGVIQKGTAPVHIEVITPTRYAAATPQMAATQIGASRMGAAQTSPARSYDNSMNVSKRSTPQAVTRTATTAANRTATTATAYQEYEPVYDQVTATSTRAYNNVAAADVPYDQMQYEQTRYEQVQNEQVQNRQAPQATSYQAERNEIQRYSTNNQNRNAGFAPQPVATNDYAATNRSDTAPVYTTHEGIEVIQSYPLTAGERYQPYGYEDNTGVNTQSRRVTQPTITRSNTVYANTNHSSNARSANKTQQTLPSGYYLQLGAYKNQTAAKKLRNQLQIQQPNDVHIETANRAGYRLHRVLVGPYSSTDSTTAAAKNLYTQGYTQTMLIKR